MIWNISQQFGKQKAANGIINIHNTVQRLPRQGACNNHIDTER